MRWPPERGVIDNKSLRKKARVGKRGGLSFSEGDSNISGGRKTLFGVTQIVRYPNIYRTERSGLGNSGQMFTQSFNVAFDVGLLHDIVGRKRRKDFRTAEFVISCVRYEYIVDQLA